MEDEQAPGRWPRPGDDGSSAPYEVMRLGIADGFKFGCGFFMATGLALLVGVLALSFGFLIASLMGVPIALSG